MQVPFVCPTKTYDALMMSIWDGRAQPAAWPSPRHGPARGMAVFRTVARDDAALGGRLVGRTHYSRTTWPTSSLDMQGRTPALASLLQSRASEHKNWMCCWHMIAGIRPGVETVANEAPGVGPVSRAGMVRDY